MLVLFCHFKKRAPVLFHQLSSLSPASLAHTENASCFSFFVLSLSRLDVSFFNYSWSKVHISGFLWTRGEIIKRERLSTNKNDTILHLLSPLYLYTIHFSLCYTT